MESFIAIGLQVHNRAGKSVEFMVPNRVYDITQQEVFCDDVDEL
jgi:hypothetical protein